MRRLRILSRTPVFGGFLKIFNVTFQTDTGGDAVGKPPQTHQIMERGDAAAVLLLNTTRKTVVLVKQPRPATVRTSGDTGMLVETIAGMIPPGETPDECAKRETFEESGYVIRGGLEHISTFFSSPGGISERMFLYYAEVTDDDHKGAGGGMASEGEYITLLHVPVAEFQQTLNNREYLDPKIIIAGQWLMAKRKDLFTRRASPDQPTVLYGVKDRRGIQIGYRVGDMAGVEDIDIWVNSENMQMFMDRFIGSTVSSTIRSMGADQDEDGNLIADNVADALQERMKRQRGKFYRVPIGTVLETTSGRLLEMKNVKSILHVATVEGRVATAAGAARGIKPFEPKNWAICVRNVLEAAHKSNTWPRWILELGSRQSILIPIFGTGDGGRTTAEAAPAMVDAALATIKSNDGFSLCRVIFAAYTDQDGRLIKQALDSRDDLIRV